MIPKLVSQEQLEQCNKMILREEYPFVQLIGTPHWDSKKQRWTCLANVDNSLAMVEVTITVPPISDEEIDQVLAGLIENGD